MTNDPSLVTPLASQSLNLPAGVAAMSSQRAYRLAPVGNHNGPPPIKELG